MKEKLSTLIKKLNDGETIVLDKTGAGKVILEMVMINGVFKSNKLQDSSSIIPYIQEDIPDHVALTYLNWLTS